MKSIRVTISAIGLSLALLSITGSCQDPDAWEKRQNDRQPPEKVMDAIGVKPGMIIGEVGAGRGRYAVHMASRTGPEGKVYAEDISKNDLEYLDKRCVRDDIKNIETILGGETDPKLPANSLDLVYIINSYHHIDQVIPLMKNIIPALKVGGKLVIIEQEPGKSGSNSHATPRKQLIKEAGEAGFSLVETIDILEIDLIYIFAAEK